MSFHLNALQRAFLDDHRQLTRGLTRILAALERGDTEEARRAADELDRSVGPHMAFEEQVFYPELARVLGSEDVAHLYDDHEAGRRAIRTLLGREQESGGAGGPAVDVSADLRDMLEHAEGCGTLLSHLAGVEPERLEQLRARLEQLRDRGVRWTELRSSEG